MLLVGGVKREAPDGAPQRGFALAAWLRNDAAGTASRRAELGVWSVVYVYMVRRVVFQPQI